MTSVVVPRLGVVGDRDLHLLLPARSGRILVVDADDGATATATAEAGHVVTAAVLDPSHVPTGCHDAVPLNGSWGTGYDSVLLCSPHRWASSVADAVSQAESARVGGGSLVVVDRPAAAWPDLFGRADVVTRRRFRHGAVSARRLLGLVGRHGPIDAVLGAAPHDRALRTLVPTVWDGNPVADAPVGAAMREVLEEARRRGATLTTILDVLPRRLVEATMPVLVVMMGPEASRRSRLAQLLPEGRGVAFNGSPQSPICTAIGQCRGHPVVLKSSRDRSWSPNDLVDVAGLAAEVGTGVFTVAPHELVEDPRAVRVGWLDGDRPGPGDIDTLATVLGTLHLAGGAPGVPVAEMTLGQGRIRLGDLIDSAISAAPDLADVIGPVHGHFDQATLVHGDWGARNARMTGGEVAMFDLDLADAAGPAGFDVGWFLLREPAAGPATVRAYEAASGRAVSKVDLAAGLVGIVTRYGAASALDAWRRSSRLGID